MGLFWDVFDLHTGHGAIMAPEHVLETLLPVLAGARGLGTRYAWTREVDARLVGDETGRSQARYAGRRNWLRTR